MAGRILNRRELRKHTDQAERGATAAPDATPAAAVKRPARVRKPRAKKAPPRLCVRWGIFDASVRQVAIFDYKQRASADAKLAELLARDKGLYYLQPVKEAMPEPPPAEMPAGPCRGPEPAE